MVAQWNPQKWVGWEELVVHGLLVCLFCWLAKWGLCGPPCPAHDGNRSLSVLLPSILNWCTDRGSQSTLFAMQTQHTVNNYQWLRGSRTFAMSNESVLWMLLIIFGSCLALKYFKNIKVTVERRLRNLIRKIARQEARWNRAQLLIQTRRMCREHQMEIPRREHQMETPRRAPTPPPAYSYGVNLTSQAPVQREEGNPTGTSDPLSPMFNLADLPVLSSLPSPVPSIIRN